MNNIYKLVSALVTRYKSDIEVRQLNGPFVFNQKSDQPRDSAPVSLINVEAIYLTKSIFTDKKYIQFAHPVHHLANKLMLPDSNAIPRK